MGGPEISIIQVSSVFQRDNKDVQVEMMAMPISLICDLYLAALVMDISPHNMITRRWDEWAPIGATSSTFSDLEVPSHCPPPARSSALLRRLDVRQDVICPGLF